ncbi:RNA-binding post-transcriptional regulator cip2 [Aspergillus lentulus]|uniref:putative R3H domain protein n=1 Tax=Aspergillus lentulus TaxID=293939 RepID=UPI001394AF67|nr:RNA-binding post-transcriptional regulator cip2 [Aspergillus lentulus]GFF25854.1 RNA-binding post-transcriptional regulator cip2 [Aspergillus lentulus]GFF64807.1 RNA-binding post-transcriptional regulator cip2 [Aspergillus lentulus]GFG00900.1 RNA-binding post-transcriptional regulator cip2 [Aspergillus lentulus]
MSYQQSQEMYHDNSSARSPGSQRHQQPLHRQPSRQFDAYGPMPVNLYDDSMARYDTGRLERLNPSLHNNSYAYDLPGSQTWNPNGFANAQTLGAIRSASASLKTTSRTGRAGLPTTWLDQQPGMPSPFSNLGPGPLQSGAVRSETTVPSEGEDELIPTAIVIKNIPFAVKKEQLVQLMTELNLPLPYAFNYHFDNGVFRGLAFANFTSAEETATVIEVLNHFELQGRKLRVEYKKMLPLQERERIEREKRERRGQLEEQHRPMAASQLQTQSSMSSLTSHIPATSPSPVSQRGQKLEVDLNDSTTLSYYSQLLLFKEDPSRDSVLFPSTLSPIQRRTVHTLAHNMGLGHASRGTGEQRQGQVFKVAPGSNVSPPLTSIPTAVQPADTARRGLNRAATIDFSEARNEGGPGPFNNLRGQTSGFLGVLDSPGNYGNTQNLRAAKSFADLRSYTPSPVPSSASFPAALQSNGARLQHYEAVTSGASNTPTLTSAPSGSSLGVQRDDNILVNSLSSLSLGTGIGGPNASPRRLRGMFSWDQPESQPSSAGPIGSNRSIGLGFDGQSQERMPIRQPRGPMPEKGSGFRRSNGHQSRGSDELRTNSGVEIIVE